MVRITIGELRRALGDTVPAPRFIATGHRRGYRFVAPVAEHTEEVLLFPQVAASLGAAYALAGRIAEALPLLEQAVAMPCISALSYTSGMDTGGKYFK